MEDNNISANNEEFAREMSEITDQKIETSHIHISEFGRHFYIQCPRENFLMLIHHYRGPFFIDLHPADYEKN